MSNTRYRMGWQVMTKDGQVGTIIRISGCTFLTGTRHAFTDYLYSVEQANGTVMFVYEAKIKRVISKRRLTRTALVAVKAAA